MRLELDQIDVWVFMALGAPSAAGTPTVALAPPPDFRYKDPVNYLYTDRRGAAGRANALCLATLAVFHVTSVTPKQLFSGHHLEP